MVSGNYFEEQRRCVRSSDGSSDRSEMHHSAKAFNDHEDAGGPYASTGRPKTNSILTDSMPRSQPVKHTIRLGRRSWFDALTDFAQAYPFADPLINVGSVERARQIQIDLLSTQVTTSRAFMVLVKNARMKIFVERDDNTGGFTDRYGTWVSRRRANNAKCGSLPTL